MEAYTKNGWVFEVHFRKNGQVYGAKSRLGESEALLQRYEEEGFEEEIKSARKVDQDQCPDGCDHDSKEHFAFDLGVEQGEQYGADAECPYLDLESDLQEAWEIGASVGHFNKVIKETVLYERTKSHPFD
jgi:hypothetical protein